MYDTNLLFENPINAKEVARMLNLNYKTVYAWASEGKIPRKKIGRKVLFWRSEVVRWLAKRK